MVSGVNGCDFTGHFSLEGALSSSLPLQTGSPAFGLCPPGILFTHFSLDTASRTLSSPLRSSQLSSAVTTHPWI